MLRQQIQTDIIRRILALEFNDKFLSIASFDFEELRSFLLSLKFDFLLFTDLGTLLVTPL
jgi:hypothetical protein